MCNAGFWVRFLGWEDPLERSDRLSIPVFLCFPGNSDGKELACNGGDLGSIPGLGRSPGGGHGNPLQYSCLENPHGQRSLVGYSPQGRKESDKTEQLSTVQLCIWFYKFVLRTFTHLCCLIFVCFRSQSIY